MHATRSRTPSWRALSREEKQARLGELRRRQQVQIEREARALRQLVGLD